MCNCKSSVPFHSKKVVESKPKEKIKEKIVYKTVVVDKSVKKLTKLTKEFQIN